ncbi:MerR family transcriptional regulator [Bacillus sp. J14TS2]|uniref:MerR family transcriptional regulator n=1 Tax=Bacillus sp. J14TS2 TaxID=2807188 RepID=UPI001B2BA173|nr:MerR family transcriptional regulator [Bacillus sp. J14TS2]GIN72161.1 MerR family transcriptional regulator [Bacillus sp. J14TS2]
MNKNLQEIFSTGEFANLFGIKKDTLLYYDKIDLFKPAGTHSNGYRYYSLKQFDSFNAIQSLRSVNFSIKDLKKYFEEPSPTKLNELATSQVEKIETEIKNLQDIQFFLSRLKDITNEIGTVKKGEIILKELPEESVIFSSAKNVDWNAPLDELSDILGDFLNEIGIKGVASNGSVINKNNFLNKKYNKADCLFCHMEGPNAIKRPAGMYAIVYYQGTYEKLESIYSFLLKELKTRQLAVDGDVFEEYLLHSLISKKEEEYITKVSVKVKKL